VPEPVSVVIAALDEAMRIGAAIEAAFASGAAEVIVADGGSRDATPEAARARGARVLTGESMRSRQFNRGAEAATQPVLIFLHADTLLPPGGAALAATALDDPIFGGFRLRFAQTSARRGLAAAMVNLRTFVSRCPWGDQAQFIRRDTFLREGGFREIPIMEDYELAQRMRRRGRTVVLGEKVITSGRRFLEKGVLRTAAINWWIILRWRMGADPAALARLYRR
jgi:rSAM/selenodomain-associated transferase 2